VPGLLERTHTLGSDFQRLLHRRLGLSRAHEDVQFRAVLDGYLDQLGMTHPFDEALHLASSGGLMLVVGFTGVAGR
jgi:hypothetical protein